MEINFNNQIITLLEGVSLQHFVDTQLGEKQKGIAIALNNTIIKKDDWSATDLKSNDNILIIKATQGG